MVDKLISFKEFCEICESIQECSKFVDKEDVLNKFIGKYKSKKASLKVPVSFSNFFFVQVNLCRSIKVYSDTCKRLYYFIVITVIFSVTKNY